MEKYIWLIIIGGVALVALIVFLATSEKRRRNKVYARLRAAFGKLPEREYTEEELLKIRSFFERVHKKGTFAVDDITWHDLHLDEVFAVVNACNSSAGEEELYRILREPVFDEKELAERDRVIRYFSDHPEERVKIQYEFAAIGHTKKVSLIEYVHRFAELKLAPDYVHFLPIVLILLAVGACFLHVTLGILAVLAAVIINLYTYYKFKGALEPWYVSLSAMAYLVNAANRVSREEVPELKDYFDRLKEEAKPLQSLKRDMKWLGAGGKGLLAMDLPEILMDYLRMMTHIDFIKFNHMVKVVRKNETHIVELMHVLGFLEAMIAVSSFRALIPFYTTGEFDREKPHLTVKDGYHILVHSPVANSISVDRPVLLTGSNASGKSTFLRTTALAVLLAETIATAPAGEVRSSFFRIYSSMALSDNLQKGESYFIVEIKSLKRMMDELPGEVPVLSFVDEVLRGTNTVERVAASSQILKKFAETGSIIFAATHDIELTNLLEPYYENYHFEEQVDGNEVKFDYVLRAGKATTRNAIKLLGMMGYEEDVIGKAEETAERFVKEGVWELS